VANIMARIHSRQFAIATESSNQRNHLKDIRRPHYQPAIVGHVARWRGELDLPTFHTEILE
jgi:hypothetical protein